MRKMEITKYLEKLDEIIDLKHLEESKNLQEDAWDYKPIKKYPVILISMDDMSKEKFNFSDWPDFTYEEIYNDKEKMLLSELKPIYEGAVLKDDKIYTIRANYGIGGIPSLFGCKIHQRGDSYPWVEHITSLDEIKKIIKNGVPEIKNDFVEKIVETEFFYKNILSKYKNLNKAVKITLPDVQGPFNIATEILGVSIFTMVYDYPDILKDLLEIITETYIKYARYHKEIIGEDLNNGYHFFYRLKVGGVRICEDNGLSLSPDMYKEFCQPYNIKVLNEFGGGYILLCGNPHHVIDIILNTPGVEAITYWSDKVEDLLKIYDKAASKKVPILWYGMIPDKYRSKIKTGIIIKQVIKSFDEGKKYLKDSFLS